MRLAELIQPAPREVRAAGVIAALPGLASVVFAVVLLIDALSGNPTTTGGNSVYGQALYYGVLGAGLLACGAGLLLGHTWARSPAVVIGLVMIGVGWYLAGPSHRPEWGVPIAVVAAGLIVLLFLERSRAWALGDDAEED